MSGALSLWVGWNLLFVVPLLLGALLCLVSVLGSSHAGQNAHGHTSHGHGHQHASHGHASHHRLHHQPHRATTQKAARGVVPPLMVLQNFLLFWGVCGLSVQILSSASTFKVPWTALIVAAGGGLTCSVLASSLLSRWLPAGTTQVVGARELEGRIGEASSPISACSGMAYVTDVHGTLHHVMCRTAENENIAAGLPVLLIEYDENADFYRVRAW